MFTQDLHKSILAMHADGTVIPSPFTIVAENGRKVTCFLTEGARIIYPQNHTHSLDHDILLVLLGRRYAEYLEPVHDLAPLFKVRYAK